MGQCLIFASTNFINDFIKLFQGSNDRHIRLILSTQSQPASFAGTSISISPHKAEGKRQENGKEKHEMKKRLFPSRPNLLSHSWLSVCSNGPTLDIFSFYIFGD
jgi:hypothetical protein